MKKIPSTIKKPKPKTNKKQKDTGTKQQQQNFSDCVASNQKFTTEELYDMLNIISDILPVGKTEWVMVGNRYNKMYPMMQRNMENIRRKYNTLANAKIPTGNPNMPEENEMAKRIKMELNKK